MSSIKIHASPDNFSIRSTHHSLRIFHMENNHPLTPREILEERRVWRYWLRWWVKYHPIFNFAKICAILTEYQAWYSVLALAEHLKLLAQLLGNLLAAAKFCNGLIGVSLTDSVIAPLVN